MIPAQHQQRFPLQKSPPLEGRATTTRNLNYEHPFDADDPRVSRGDASRKIHDGLPWRFTPETLTRAGLEALAKEAAVFATDTMAQGVNHTIPAHQARSVREAKLLFRDGAGDRRQNSNKELRGGAGGGAPRVRPLRLFQERNKAGRTWEQEGRRVPALALEIWKRLYRAAKTNNNDTMLRVTQPASNV